VLKPTGLKLIQKSGATERRDIVNVTRKKFAKETNSSITRMLKRLGNANESIAEIIQNKLV